MMVSTAQTNWAGPSHKEIKMMVSTAQTNWAGPSRKEILMDMRQRN